jgi:hypothetical protein
MRPLTNEEIVQFSSRRGVHRHEVEMFLDTVGQEKTIDNEFLTLYYEARRHKWNISTVKAIEAGIKFAYKKKPNH